MFLVQLPKKWPEIAIEGMQVGIPGYNRPKPWPITRIFHQSSADRVTQDIKASGGKCILLTRWFAQHRIVGLLLQFIRRMARPGPAREFYLDKSS